MHYEIRKKDYLLNWVFFNLFRATVPQERFFVMRGIHVCLSDRFFFSCELKNIVSLVLKCVFELFCAQIEKVKA